MTTYQARCGKCGVTRDYPGMALDLVRMQVCPACRVRLTVVGHEERAETLTELPAVETPPGIEFTVLTERRNDIARGLVLSALGE